MAPKYFSVRLTAHGYHMEINTQKDDCNNVLPHWHLFNRTTKIGSITTCGNWLDKPDMTPDIQKEAEELTDMYGNIISEIYTFNRVHHG